MTGRNKKIAAVAMSGGVDSSVSALLLKQKGYTVIGVMMKIWDRRPLPEEGSRHSCYGPGEIQDLEDAKKTAEHIGIEFYSFDLAEDYNQFVIKPFCKEYLSGRTPNPCVLCNHKVKFGALMKRVKDAGIDFDIFATGHYARTEYDALTRRFLLKKGRDMKKDQSYFLYYLTQTQLKKIMFPLGNYLKSEVKKIAEEFGLKLAFKKESQDFIAGSDYSILFSGDFQPGAILDQDGEKIGEHKGIIFYTIGQRKGLKISSRKPLYVTDIDPQNNVIRVGPIEKLYHRTLIAENMNWISMDEPVKPIKVKARIRQQHKEADATVFPLKQNQVQVIFDEPQIAITPGQAVVLYQDEVVLAGGTIKEVIKN